MTNFSEFRTDYISQVVGLNKFCADCISRIQNKFGEKKLKTQKVLKHALSLGDIILILNISNFITNLRRQNKNLYMIYCFVLLSED